MKTFRKKLALALLGVMCLTGCKDGTDKIVDTWSFNFSSVRKVSENWDTWKLAYGDNLQSFLKLCTCYTIQERFAISYAQWSLTMTDMKQEEYSFAPSSGNYEDRNNYYCKSEISYRMSGKDKYRTYVYFTKTYYEAAEGYAPSGKDFVNYVSSGNWKIKIDITERYKVNMTSF